MNRWRNRLWWWVFCFWFDLACLKQKIFRMILGRSFWKKG